VNEEQKRAYVSDLYDGPKWKKRVKKMSDDQVTAIYLKHQRDGQMPEEEPEDIDLDLDLDLDDDPDEDLYFEDADEDADHLIDTYRGPHANEDDFPTY